MTSHDKGKGDVVGWEVPPEPSCTKSDEQLRREREVAPGESFAFRVHKRGAHRYAEPTPELEYTVGGAVWDALARRDGTLPRVDLTRPDVLVNAEVLGPTTLVGIVRRWRDE